MNSLDLKIREWLTHYLAKQISFEEFENWFVPATWEVQKSGNQMAVNLANEIELRIAEFTNGHLTENELKNRFRPLTQQYSVRIAYGTSSGPAYTTGLQGPVQGRSVGTLSSVEHV